jgi:hypothetical protein
MFVCSLFHYANKNLAHIFAHHSVLDFLLVLGICLSLCLQGSIQSWYLCVGWRPAAWYSFSWDSTCRQIVKKFPPFLRTEFFYRVQKGPPKTVASRITSWDSFSWDSTCRQIVKKFPLYLRTEFFLSCSEGPTENCCKPHYPSPHL